MPEVLAHAPPLLGLLLNNVNNNNPTAAYVFTVVVQEQIAEANYLRGMGELQDFSRFLYPPPTHLFFSLFFLLRSIYPKSSSPTYSTDQSIAKFIPAN